MKGFKKIGALLLALVMVLAMSVTAFADGEATLTGGEVGGYTAADTQNLDNKKINIEKDLVAYNPDESYVYGPDLDFTYTIAAGTTGVQITDATTDHTSGVSSVTTTLAGVGVGTTLKVNGAVSATGTISWENTDILETSAAGTANKKYLSLDFTDVVFSQPGVYRYMITETEHTDAEYAAAGVTETTGSHVRYLDVYVMRSATFDPTHTGESGHAYVAGDWRVYGFVCVYNTSAAIDDTDSNHAVKTNGFVAGTSDGSAAITADEYYTYNLTVTKDLVGDNTMINHQFPITVAFDDADSVTGTFQLIAETDGSKSSLTTSGNAAGTTVNGTAIAADTVKKVGSAVALESFANAGTPKIADGSTDTGTTVGKIKYIGIPYGVTATVTETNDNVGTTYTATVKEDDTTNAGTTLVATTLTSTTGTMATGNASASIDNTENAARTAAVTNHNVAIEFTNTLAIISPTGYVARIAPYALMLAAGITLLVIFMKRRKPATEDEE